MIDYEILQDCNTTSDRLRDIFTCTDTDKPEHKLRKKWEEKIEANIYEGMMFSMEHEAIYRAIDMAWDAPPIQKELLPLMLYAQGKITMQSCARSLRESKSTDKYCDKGKDGEIKAINVPRINEAQFNIIRSYITRRGAAQSDRYNAYPYLKYDPMGTTPEARLKADVMTQRAEVMSDQYGYRHLMDQWTRNCLLYGKSIAFPTSAWQRDIQWRKKPLDEGFKSDNVADKFESYTTREGVDFATPHPTRVFWDNSAPPSQMNYDLGPQWIGYWDVSRYGQIKGDNRYWNNSDVACTDRLMGIWSDNLDYFNYYYSDADDTKKTFPTCSTASTSLSTLNNDRQALTGKYSSEDDDAAIYLTNYYARVKPVDEGFGDYAGYVWMHLLVAADNTVIYGEFLPSLPGLYFGYNEHDGRQVNLSMAHELLPYNDQLNTLLTHLFMRIRQGLFQIWAVDEDALDDKMKAYLESSAKGTMYSYEAMMLFYSGAKFRDVGIDPKTFIQIISNSMEADINSAFSNIQQILNIVDRNLMMSPMEAAQVTPHEVTAQEVQQVANSTNSMYNFVSKGLDEGRAALKKVIFESLVACSKEPLRVPVMGRYSKKVVEDAGFSIEDGSSDIADDVARRRVIIGDIENIIYEFQYNCRDGANRSSNAQSAQTLMQLMGPILGNQQLAGLLGVEKIKEYLNTIFQLSGAPMDLNLDTAPEEAAGGSQDPGGGAQQPAGGAQPAGAAAAGAPQSMTLEQIQGILPQIMAQLQQQGATLQQLTGGGAAAAPAPAAEAPPAAAPTESPAGPQVPAGPPA